MYILGLNAYHADSSAAILKDGVLIAAIEEERFKRVKHWAGFPSESIQFCLKEAGIEINQVDHIGIGRDPFAKLGKKLLFIVKNPGIGLEAVQQRLKNSRQIASLENEFAKYFPGIDIKQLKSKIHQVEHHRAHLASAFFASPFPEAALLSIDGSGDFTTTMLGQGSNSKMEIMSSIDFPHSIGIFYSAFTQFLGFQHYGDEYKVMGLAPYGKPVYLEQLRKIVLLKNEGSFQLDLSYFMVTKGNIISYGTDHVPVIETLYSKKIEEVFGPPRKSGGELNQHYKDIAASVQQYTEEIIFHLLRTLHEKTKLDAVCIAGGVAQNSVANGKITKNTPFTKVYIPSAGHDAGISMGSAFYIQHQVLHQERNGEVKNAFLGSHFSNSEIENILHKENVKYKKYNDQELMDIVTDKLIDGGVVGWFNGKAEFGPRALGGRSIIVDPRRSDAKQLLNAKIKKRESFRPFAPSILKEFEYEYFETEDDVPFMEKVYPIRAEKQNLIPAVTHVDGTGRVQTVSEKINPRYYQLIRRFYDKTGIPILLNTSFNENEPIVNTPQEALDCFMRTSMDMLVLENFTIVRD